MLLAICGRSQCMDCFCQAEPIRERELNARGYRRPGILVRLLQLGEELLQVGDFPMQRGHGIGHGQERLFRPL